MLKHMVSFDCGLTASLHFPEQVTPPSSQYEINIVTSGEPTSHHEEFKNLDPSQSCEEGSRKFPSSISQHNCKVCKEFFPSDKGRKLHEKSCFMMYDCDSCGQKLQRQNEEKANSFKQRVSDHKRKCSRNYLCENCGEEFSTKWTLNRHMERNLCSKQKIECNICKKVFISQRALSVHTTKWHT